MMANRTNQGFKLGLLALSLILIVPILSACGSGTSSPTSSESYTTIAVTATAETEIYNNGNLSGVENNPTYDTTFDITDSYEVTSITDYHWNNGLGAKGGTIGLEDSDGNEIGTWPVTVRSGVYWDVHPNTVIDPGEYKVVDSDPSTWAQNLESDNSGITDVKGYAITYVVSKNTTNPTTNGTTAAAPLVTKSVTPSTSPQIVSYQDKVGVIIPAGTLDSNQTVSISPAPSGLPANPCTGLTEVASYDVSIGNLKDLKRPVTVEIAYDPSIVPSGSTVDKTLAVSYWDTNLQTWVSSPYVADTTRHVIMIPTMHLTTWKIWAWAKSWKYLESDHFIIFYDPVAVVDVGEAEITDKYGRVSVNLQDPRSHTPDLAARVQTILENAYNAYSTYKDPHSTTNDTGFNMAMTYLPASAMGAGVGLATGAAVGAVTGGPMGGIAGAREGAQAGGVIGSVIGAVVVGGKTNVFLDQAAENPFWSPPTGNISVPLHFDTYEHLRHELCHELFHAVQNSYYPITGMALRRWWVEACAEYAADNVATTGVKATTTIAADYLQKPLSTVDNVHEYTTRLFIDYIVNKYGASFKGMWDADATQWSVNGLEYNLSTYLQTTVKVGLQDCYQAFAQYVLFDASSPLNIQGTLWDAVANPTMTVDPQATPQTFTVSLDGDYTAKLIGIRVKPDPKSTSQQITVTATDGVTGYTKLYGYVVPGDDRTKSKSVGGAFGNKQAITASIGANDTLYVLATNTSATAQTITLQVSAASGQKWVQTGITQTLDPATAAPGKSVTISGSKATFAVDSQAGVYKANWSCTWKGTPPNTPPLNWSGTATGTPGPGNTLNLTVSGTSNGVTYQGQWLAYYPASSAASYFTSDWSGKVTVVSTENGASQNVIAESGGSGDKSDWVFAWPDLPTTLTPGQTFTGTLTANDGGSAIATQDSVSGLLEFVLNPPWSGMTPGMGLESPSVSVKVPGKPTASRNFTWEIPGPTNKQMTITVSCSAVNGGSVAQAKIVYTYELR